MKHVLDLQVFDGDKLVASGRFEQGKIVMGRILSADFRIPDSRVSRIHALLERLDDGSLRVTDLASTHGTTVNGERVIERVVGPADDLRIAGLKLQMTFSMVEDSPEPVRAAPAAKASASGARASVPPSMAAPQVRVSGDPTVVRSLKASAHSRGVLEATSKPHEELEVTVYWGETILNIDHCRDRRKTIRIGETTGNDYIVASNVLPPHFDFIRVNGSEAEIQMHPSMRGSARVNGKIVRFEQEAPGASVPPSLRISGDDIAKIQVGSVHFFLMFVGKPPETRRDAIFDQGRLFWVLQILFSLLAIAAIILTSQYKAPIEGRVKEFPERFRRVIVQAYKAQTRPPIEGDKAQQGQTTPNAQKTATQAQQGGNDSAGAKEQGEQGKRGETQAQQTAGVEKRPPTTKPTPTPSTKPAPAPAPKVAEQVKQAPAPKPSPTAKPKPLPMHTPKPVPTTAETILSALKSSGLSAGSGQGRSGQTAVDQAFSGVGGTTGSSQGTGGSGLQGAGRGGGGQAVGVGGLGTTGFGSGQQGTGTGSIPGKGEVEIGTESLSVFVLGSLTREEIERVIRAHHPEVRNCYDREIARNPGLAGKVTLKWTIVEGGRVENVSTKENTTGSRSLSDCIAANLKGWKFPTPAQGSSADVEWPFVFKPRGS